MWGASRYCFRSERDSASGGTASGPLTTASDDTQKRPDDF